MTISRIAQRFQPIVFALLLFTIPSNLFAKFFVNSAYVDGLIVDYLIPKLYLSDIFVIALILLWCAELGFSTVAVRLRKHVISILIVLGFLALNFLASLNTGHWPATLYFDLKLLEMWGLLAWLFTHRSLLLSSKTVIALSSAIIFEAAVGVYQSIAQRSVFGFWFFGEPMLNLDVTVAKSNYSGALRILPYGTTPHPNILAGFMVMATLMCLYIGLHQEKKMIRVSALILAVVSSIMAILTQSFSAATALVLGLTLFCTYQILPKNNNVQRRLSLVSRTLAGVILIGIPVLLLLVQSPDSSILRRNQLEAIALRIFAAHPLFGVGLNQFTAAMSGFGNVSANLRFLQPVHNVPLLWLAETGILGCVLIAFVVNVVHKKYSLNPVAFLILGIPYLILISLDHYALSVQSGVVLSTILVATMLEKKSQLHG